jgi:hypothetical protein
MRNAAFGFVACAVGIAGSIWFYSDALNNSAASKKNVIKQDAPPPPAGVIPEPSAIAEANDKVPTGTSTIPFFPRTIHLSSTQTSTQTPSDTPSSGIPSGGVPPLPETLVQGETEYHLLGLGIRTVSIFSIQVYVVGLYIATADIATLQQSLIREIDPVATTLVPNEKTKLHDLLMDPIKGEEIFNTLLKKGGIRSAIRIVPTRNTDWMHMRDGFVRGITARSQHFASLPPPPTTTSTDTGSSAGAASGGEFQDSSFGEALNQFKAIFTGSKRKLPKEEILYLTRSPSGSTSAIHEDKSGTRTYMGSVHDERVGRLLWLGYMAGKGVSSEEARRSVVEGCVEVCGRPVGTVAEQVV